VDRTGHVIHTRDKKSYWIVTAKRQLGRLGMRREDNVVVNIKETVVRTGV